MKADDSRSDVSNGAVSPGHLVLEVENLTHKYRGRSGIFKRFEHTVLNNVSFKLYRGENLGVVGRNGCGKSTLLRILCGVINPTSGSVHTAPGITRSLLALGLGFNPDLSGRDNALLSAMLQGNTKREAKALLEGIQRFSELGEFFDRPVKTYSAGMRSRLGFSTAITADVDILLVDETLSVGDEQFKHKAEASISDKLSSDKAVVLVSHNISEIKRLCDRALWLDGGRIRSEGATDKVLQDYSDFIERMEKADLSDR